MIFFRKDINVKNSIWFDLAYFGYFGGDGSNIFFVKANGIYLIN